MLRSRNEGVTWVSDTQFLHSADESVPGQHRVSCPLPPMLSDKVRTWKEGIQGIHLSGGECGIQRGAVIFLGLLLVTSLLILFMVLL